MERNYDALYDMVRDVLDDMNTDELIVIHNAFCERNYYAEIVLDMGELDDTIDDWTPTEILRNATDGFDTNDSYFFISDCEDLTSFNFASDYDSPIDIDALAKYIVENEDDFGFDDIKDILEDDEEEEEENE